MKQKTTFTLFLCLILCLGSVEFSLSAEPPTYDATGIWGYQITNVYNSCPTLPPIAMFGTVAIYQVGNTFELNSGDETDYGTVSGNRYQIFESGSDSSGSGTETQVWSLNSPTIAR